MKKIFLIISLLVAINSVFGQTLYTRKNSFPIIQDSVTLQAGPFRGVLQWQHSQDGKTWNNLNGKTKETLKVIKSAEGYYRAEIIDGNCFPAYSDTAQIKPGFTVSKDMAAQTGGSITTPDNSILIIPANSLQADGRVSISTMEGSEQPVIANQNLQRFGNSYKLEIPGNNLLHNVTLTFTLDSVPSPIENYALFLYDGKNFLPIEYSITGNTVTAQIDCINLKTPYSLKNIRVLSELIILGLVVKQTPPANEMGLKEVHLSGGNLTFSTPSTVTDTTKVLLLVHGWCDKPQTWASFVQYITSQPDIKFDKIWTFGYNSSWGIDENGAKLLGGLAIYSHGAKVKIVAHSMGGLVARSMIEHYGGSIYVKKLVTLGTPHLGSPLGALRSVLGYIIDIESTLDECIPGSSFIYDYTTQGFRDLDESSSFISKLKNTQTSPVSYYCIAAVNKPSDNVLIPDEDDFAVGVLSALGAPTPISLGKTEITCSFPNIAHNNLLINQGVFNKTKEYLKDNFTLKVIQGDKQTGIAGKALPLPIIVQVLDEMNKPVKGAKVYFESEFYPGQYLTIDSREDGKVAVEWTLDKVEGTQKIAVFLMDDSGKKIEKSAITITAECKKGDCTTGTFTDPRDGHIYKTVQIGAQTWMAENLAYLPYTTPTSTWSNTTPCYYVYNQAVYGVLYNWPAALTACPPGWHLPSDAEWDILSNYLGGDAVAGGKMKATTGWNSPNTGATNESCFSALPGGYYNGGHVDSAGSRGGWWSSTAYDEYNAWNRGLDYGYAWLYRGYAGRYPGFSVRCVRD